MSDLSTREVIDRIARGLELTRQEFAKPKATAEARRAAPAMVKRKKARSQASQNARSKIRSVRRSRAVSPVVNRGSQPIRTVGVNNSAAANKIVERLLQSLKEDREALAEKEFAERVAQSRRAVYFVLTFAAGIIAGVALMKGLLAQHLI